MKIALGSDHRGNPVTLDLRSYLKAHGHEPVVYEACEKESCDYPEPAYDVAKAVIEGRADRGILACGSGIGMSIAANKVDGIRAALVYDEVAAGRSRAHNNANVLCLSPEMTSLEQVRKIVDVWLKTPFDGGRHARRLAKIEAIERGEDPKNLKWEPDTATADTAAG